MKQFSRLQPRQLVDEWLVRSVMFHHPRFARRDIEGCQSPALTASSALDSGDRGEETGFTGIEKFGVNKCPRCVETYDLASHKSFRQFGIFHLFAQGDGTSGFQQFCNV